MKSRTVKIILVRNGCVEKSETLLQLNNFEKNTPAIRQGFGFPLFKTGGAMIFIAPPVRFIFCIRRVYSA